MCVSVWVTAQPPWPRAVARRQSAIRKSSSELEPDEFHRHPYLHGLLFGDLFRIKGECTRHGGRKDGAVKKGGWRTPPTSSSSSSLALSHTHPCLHILFITPNSLSLPLSPFFLHHIFTYMQAAVRVCSCALMCLQHLRFTPLPPKTTSHTIHIFHNCY